MADKLWSLKEKDDLFIQSARKMLQEAKEPADGSKAHKKIVK